jgi:hypothetical protein
MKTWIQYLERISLEGNKAQEKRKRTSLVELLQLGRIQVGDGICDARDAPIAILKKNGDSVNVA